jgi:hypothetical protein
VLLAIEQFAAGPTNSLLAAHQVDPGYGSFKKDYMQCLFRRKQISIVSGELCPIIIRLTMIGITYLLSNQIYQRHI